VTRLAPLLLIGLAVACSGPRPQAENVVLITVDTLRADMLGPYGSDLPTPGFDALARDGVVVEGACTPTPSTGPAHASLFTGLHPWNHGILLNATPLDPSLPSLTESVRAAGLDTAAFVASFIVAARWGFDRGFGLFHFEPSRLWKWQGEPIGFYNEAGEITDAALEWIEHHRERRFFVWLHYFDPHSPYGAPQPFRRPASEVIDLAGKELPSKVESLAHLAGLIRAYRGEVAYVDAQMLRLTQKLSDLGLLERTTVVMTADHGEGLGDHGWLGHGRNLHDELVTVPLIVRGPGIPAGRRLRGAAQLEDLMPTLLSLLGQPIPDGLDGVDLAPWLRGEVAESPRDAVVGRRAGYPDMPALFFERRWPEKWIGPLDGAGDHYRLDADPREAVARSGPPPELLRQRVAAGVGRAGEQVLDEEARRALEALGYLGGDADGTVE
jgi:arylsulfatase A-like enzyme